MSALPVGLPCISGPGGPPVRSESAVVSEAAPVATVVPESERHGDARVVRAVIVVGRVVGTVRVVAPVRRRVPIVVVATLGLQHLRDQGVGDSRALQGADLLGIEMESRAAVLDL